MNRRHFLKQLLSVAAAPYIFDVGANLWRKQPEIIHIPWADGGFNADDRFLLLVKGNCRETYCSPRNVCFDPQWRRVFNQTKR